MRLQDYNGFDEPGGLENVPLKALRLGAESFI